MSLWGYGCIETQRLWGPVNYALGREGNASTVLSYTYGIPPSLELANGIWFFSGDDWWGCSTLKLSVHVPSPRALCGSS